MLGRHPHQERHEAREVSPAHPAQLAAQRNVFPRLRLGGTEQARGNFGTLPGAVIRAAL
jgi:hypothetical protein